MADSMARLMAALEGISTEQLGLVLRFAKFLLQEQKARERKNHLELGPEQPQTD